MAKQAKTIRQDNYKRHLIPLVESNDEARLLKNRYEVMKGCLQLEWINTMRAIGVESIDAFIQDIVYLDRKIREVTEPYDKESKKIAEQEWLLENGYEVGVDSDIHKLKTL